MEQLCASTDRLLVRPVHSAAAWFALRLWGAKVGRGLRVMGRVRLRNGGTLAIGDHVQIRSGYANFVGAHQPMALWVCPGGALTIGDRCRISNTTIVCAASITLLEGTLVGGGSQIYDTDFHQMDAESRLANRGPVASAPVRIGPRAFLGGHVTVLKGVTIGEGAVVGACSVVTRDVPAFEVWAGVPARRIRSLPRLERDDAVEGGGGIPV